MKFLYYKISTSTVSRWWSIYQKEKRITCKARGGSKGKINPSTLSKFVEKNPDKTLSEIGEVFGIKASSVHSRLKSLNFSYKKAFTYVEADEEKRKEYQEQIEQIPKDIVN